MERHKFVSVPVRSMGLGIVICCQLTPRVEIGGSTHLRNYPFGYPAPLLPRPQDGLLFLAGASQPPTQGYLHSGIVGSIDFVSADGGHWHVAPELGAWGREEGQGVHATQ